MDYSLYYLQEFKKYISLQTASPNTIKNYLSDLRLFLFFITTNQHLTLDPSHLPSYINEDFITRYGEFLSVTNPPATAKRRISSLKKFIDYCSTQGIYPIQPSVSFPNTGVQPASSFPFIPPAVTPPTSPVFPEFSELPSYSPPVSPPVSPESQQPSYSPPVSPPVSPVTETSYISSPPPSTTVSPPPEISPTPVNREIPQVSNITGNILPDPGNLVHDFIDLKPVSSVSQSQPAPAVSASPSSPNSYLPVIVSVASFLASFSLTLLIHMLFFK
jgi:hypothetical protein